MLTNKAKYALKAMIALSRCAPGALLQSAELAEQENIPKKFLDLILLELRKHGFIRSVRGKKGGYMLGKAPDVIYVGQIIRVIDGPLAPIACASVTAYQTCHDCDERTCAVRRMMRHVRDAASEILDHMTLLDAAKSELKAKQPSARANRSHAKSVERV